MTKLVDVQGLKPCPEWGSGSSPDIGSIHNLSYLVVIKLVSPYFIKTSWLYCAVYHTQVLNLTIITSSWLVHSLFIFVFLLAFIFKPATLKIFNILCF